jgi:hypothetical protein
VSLFLDIGQGAGLAGATGVRPYLPPLLTGALARADAGIDFDDTAYDFLESTWFLSLLLALAVAAYLIERLRTREDPRLASPSERRAEVQGRLPWLTLADGMLVTAALVLGALLFAGSLEAGGHFGTWGLAAGFVCAALGYLAVAGIFAGARRRLSGSGAGLVDAYADAVALVMALLAVFLDPSGYVFLVVFAVLILRSRRSGGEKYAGLRILR